MTILLFVHQNCKRGEMAFLMSEMRVNTFFLLLVLILQPGMP